MCITRWVTLQFQAVQRSVDRNQFTAIYSRYSPGIWELVFDKFQHEDAVAAFQVELIAPTEKMRYVCFNYFVNDMLLTSRR